MRSDRFARYLAAIGPISALRAVVSKALRVPVVLQARAPGVAFPVHVRYPSTDLPTFGQIFFNEDYRFDVLRDPRVIVDAGANIGLASVYFANRYPASRIVAVEPEPGNLEMLKRNASYYSNIEVEAAALWNATGHIALLDPGLGEWGFMTGSHEREGYPGEVIGKVRATTIDKLMRDRGIDRIDILKIDIEGAEREVFEDASAWIDKVDLLVVELHDRIKPGCGESVVAAAAGFDHRWTQGENLCFGRAPRDDGDCITEVFAP